jgi:hypothetical protein
VHRRQLAQSSDGYGGAFFYAQLLHAQQQTSSVELQLLRRAIVLQFVSRTVTGLEEGGGEGGEGGTTLDLLDCYHAETLHESRLPSIICSAAHRVLGTALLALPTPPAKINVAHCMLKPRGLGPIVELVACGGVSHLNLDGNDDLGDACVSMLAKKLPPALQCLGVTGVGIGEKSCCCCCCCCSWTPRRISYC